MKPVDETVTLSDLAATEGFAKRLSKEIAAGVSVGLSGTLGAGKTTFSRLLLNAWGYAKPVSSPTYVLHHEYTLESGIIVDHWDLYRLTEAPDELLTRCPANHIRLVEWPEKAPEILDELDLRLHFTYAEDGSPDSRLVEISRLSS